SDRDGRDRLRDHHHHRLQPDRRPALRGDRPPNPAGIVPGRNRIMSLLEVNDLKTYFRTDDGIVKAVDGISFSVEKGKTLGIVGESACVKSVTCLTIIGLNNRKNTISSGEALWKGKNLIGMGPKELRKIRGSEIAMIFQDPMTSLNPVHKVGQQLVEAILLHQDVTKA